MVPQHDLQRAHPGAVQLPRAGPVDGDEFLGGRGVGIAVPGGRGQRADLLPDGGVVPVRQRGRARDRGEIHADAGHGRLRALRGGAVHEQPLPQLVAAAAGGGAVRPQRGRVLARGEQHRARVPGARPAGLLPRAVAVLPRRGPDPRRRDQPRAERAPQHRGERELRRVLGVCGAAGLRPGGGHAAHAAGEGPAARRRARAAAAGRGRRARRAEAHAALAGGAQRAADRPADRPGHLHRGRHVHVPRSLVQRARPRAGQFPVRVLGAPGRECAGLCAGPCAGESEGQGPGRVCGRHDPAGRRVGVGDGDHLDISGEGPGGARLGGSRLREGLGALSVLGGHVPGELYVFVLRDRQLGPQQGRGRAVVGAAARHRVGRAGGFVRAEQRRHHGLGRRHVSQLCAVGRLRVPCVAGGPPDWHHAGRSEEGEGGGARVGSSPRGTDGSTDTYG